MKRLLFLEKCVYAINCVTRILLSLTQTQYLALNAFYCKYNRWSLQWRRYVQGHDFRTQQIEVLNGTCFMERLLGLLSGDVLHVKILKVQPAPKGLIISEMPL